MKSRINYRPKRCIRGSQRHQGPRGRKSEAPSLFLEPNINKYPVQGFAIEGAQLSADVAGTDYQKLSGHSYVKEDVRKALMAKYKHPFYQQMETQAKELGAIAHGGMDFIMDYRLAHCLQNGLPLDMDVYDLAEWSCITEISAISLENGSVPVTIPDFTRGGWNRIKGYRHAGL